MIFSSSNKNTTKEELLLELKIMGIEDKILQAISEVDRTKFVDPKFIEEAYGNYPLPIGQGQTISQPYTVAYMIQLLELKKGDKVLEVGAGCGYNAAVMAKIVGEEGKIISLEIVDELIIKAQNNLKKIKVLNVDVIKKNAYNGYQEESPYDKIIVTAGSLEIPPKLLAQLNEKGIMIIPINQNSHQVMTKIIKEKKNEITEHGTFRFVPFIRE